ncbi:MAG: hypothetical protein B7X34_08070 [Acidobacteriia bacterium 12-62-4]|nr:MAG: hypothetical protein B7X34_08070 [Acidobacteriia bacterium 12-62-4]
MNELKFGVNYFKSSNSQTRAGVRNVVEELGIPAIDRTNPLFWGIPVLQISGYSNVGECNDCPFVNWNTTGMLTDNFSWNRGKYQFKIGGRVRRVRYNQIGAVVPRGRFSRSAVSTPAMRWRASCSARYRTRKAKSGRQSRTCAATT